jgi:hypothetical protein
MPKLKLTYWWDGHGPDEVVEVDEVTARAIAAITTPVKDEKPQKPRATTAKADD